MIRSLSSRPLAEQRRHTRTSRVAKSRLGSRGSIFGTGAQFWQDVRTMTGRTKASAARFAQRVPGIRAPPQNSRPPSHPA